MSATPKKRLDMLVQEQHPEWSRTQIQSWIMQGKVLVNDKKETKPGTATPIDAVIIAKIEEPKFVSRGGFKLEKALDNFGLDVTGMIALDAGISTGGFTDCLLQRGIARVYGIDVGYGQVHEKVANDKRVIVMEKVNLRNLEGIAKIIDLVTLDLSFISVLKVIPTILNVLKDNGCVVILIKPQFEAARHEVSRGGIVRDEKVHTKVIDAICIGMREFGFKTMGIIDSPITGATGNKEFLGLFIKNNNIKDEATGQ